MRNNIFSMAMWIPSFLLICIGMDMSCTKLVQIPPPDNSIITSRVFADSADAVGAVLGMYINFSETPQLLNFCDGGITAYTGLSSDELTTTVADPILNEYYIDDISAIDNEYDYMDIWVPAYAYIYQANACIEGLTASTSLSAALKNQLIGESEVVRAMLYFNMVNLYGAVPLISTINYASNAVVPRTATDTVYLKIIADLMDAQSRLVAAYPSSGVVRPNMYTAEALLSKAYLYTQQWGNAAVSATSVIESGLYQLDSNLNNVFLANSTESIWQLMPVVPGDETQEGLVFIPSSGTAPSYPIDSFLLKAFEPGDQRFVNWLDSVVVNGQTYYYPYKYKLGDDGNTSPAEYYTVFRLADQYLIRAEAEAQLNELSPAISDLNIIRNRAGLMNTTANTQSELLTAILHERQIEFFCEWGNRWYDLKRTNTINQVMGAPGNVCSAKSMVNWNADWALYPIPYVELKANYTLIQNPGY